MAKHGRGTGRGTQKTRLDADGLASLFAGWPADLCDLAVDYQPKAE